MNKISVCIASYNGEKYIERQLLSILKQLGDNDEVVLSDDNSTDNTLSIVSRLSDERIKIVYNEGRSGPTGNFEHALKIATGDYILLSDQDDVWELGKVDAMRTLLDTNDLVLSDCQVVDEMGKIVYPSFFKYRDSKPGFWRNLYKNSYIGCCMAFRRQVLSYALPFPTHIHMHDWWIGLLTEVKGKVCFYPRPMIKYVRHGNNASPTAGKKQKFSSIKQFSNRFFILINVINRLSLWR